MNKKLTDSGDSSAVLVNGRTVVLGGDVGSSGGGGLTGGGRWRGSAERAILRLRPKRRGVYRWLCWILLFLLKPLIHPLVIHLQAPGIGLQPPDLRCGGIYVQDHVVYDVHRLDIEVLIPDLHS